MRRSCCTRCTRCSLPPHPGVPRARQTAKELDDHGNRLSNARIVLDEEVLHGSVLIRDGLIADIGSGPGTAGEDLGGDHLLPGVVELHTDHLEYHFNPRPGVQWDPLPAVLASDAQLAAAGATTVLDAVRVGSGPGEHDGTTDGRPAPGGLDRAGGRRAACCAPITRSTCAARCPAPTASTHSAGSPTTRTCGWFR